MRKLKELAKYYFPKCKICKGRLRRGLMTLNLVMFTTFNCLPSNHTLYV